MAMTNETLGRLERVDVREIWSSESSDFTPWLGREGNLAILGETLGIELELERRRRRSGRFARTCSAGMANRKHGCSSRTSSSAPIMSISARSAERSGSGSAAAVVRHKAGRRPGGDGHCRLRDRNAPVTRDGPPSGGPDRFAHRGAPARSSEVSEKGRLAIPSNRSQWEQGIRGSRTMPVIGRKITGSQRVKMKAEMVVRVAGEVDTARCRAGFLTLRDIGPLLTLSQTLGSTVRRAHRGSRSC